MKRLISILLLVVILLSCCACDKQTETTEATQIKSTKDMTPEEMYGDIDQTKPVDGVYKVWGLAGFQQMAKTPNATFEILCHIDLEGATLAPIPEFTGKIIGGSWTVSNFTVAGDGENFGFIAVNKGDVQNMTLEKVTFQPGGNAKNIGALAGINEGKFLRCYVNDSDMAVTAAADNASCGGFVGVNTGFLGNMGGAVRIDYTASGAAMVGGLVGTAKGGTAEYIINDGKLTVTGTNKTVGLFAGDATEAIFVNCVWRGEDNSLDGKLFTNFTGNADDDELIVAEDALWRDNGCIEPLSDEIMAVRNKAVKAMEQLVTVEWRVTQDLVHTCTCQLSGCHGTYSDQYLYIGTPYNHKCSSITRFNYILNEDKTVAEWFYGLDSFDGFDIYIGNDCSSCVQQAWWTVSNTTNTMNTSYIAPAYGKGTVAVGNWTSDFQMKTETRDGVKTTFTAQYLEATDYQVMMESYAAMRPGDAILNRVAAGGHTQMCATFPVIVRNQKGEINAEYSYAKFHEEGGTSNQADEPNGILSSCSYYDQYSFAWLYNDCYVPVSTIELQTGKQDPVEATLEGAVEGYSGMFTGRVKTNYHLDYAKLTVVDSQGNTVLDHPIFATTQKSGDYGGNYFTARMYTDWLDMGSFAGIMGMVQLEKGETYTYKVTAGLATLDQIVVHESEFTYG